MANTAWGWRTMHILLALGCAMVALAWFGLGGGVLGAVLGLLAAEVLALRRRLTALERGQVAKVIATEEVIFQPVEEARPIPPRPRAPGGERAETPTASKEDASPSRLDRLLESLGQSGSGLVGIVHRVVDRCARFVLW